ncbi:cystathionine beta-synthase [Anaeramoeba ignava]|uniref:Cystathionine beta-synthase n=1 Tax=Anaeramoeba ignava TaxID=1746090 RepID=A0A9Q0RCH1_ANAIG|nr:cystathionine beta-synthase [Anaeramoeba ignava]
MEKITKEQVLANTIERCKKQNIIIPTYEQMAHPEKIPKEIIDELSNVGLWDINSRNLFRLTWKNEPKEFGGKFGPVNRIELPSIFTGVKSRIFILIGKFFPTGSHKVGATFGPLVEKLTRGEFDPTTQKVYPTIKTESNVKEEFDKTKELKETYGDQIVVLNQFAEFGNPLWHYYVTGGAIEEVYNEEKKEGQRLSGLFLTQGSGGTLGSSMYLHQKYPLMKTGAGEAVECPTLLQNGFGEHQIEGIGDKHVPWILNIKDLDAVVGIQDDQCMRLFRLFNEPAGHKILLKNGIPKDFVDNLHLFGISSIANIIGAIQMAKYYEMNQNDILFTVATDSAQMYTSRLKEMTEKFGEYTETQAMIDFEAVLKSISPLHFRELTYYEKKRMHNLKYFTWIEQQGKTSEELNKQWYDDNYWLDRMNQYKQWDEQINQFNERTGLLKDLLEKKK